MSPSHSLVIYSTLIFWRRIIFDAGWSLTESTLMRTIGVKGFPRILKTYSLDFLAFHLAKDVILESQEQIDFISKYFLVPRKIA